MYGAPFGVHQDRIQTDWLRSPLQQCSVDAQTSSAQASSNPRPICHSLENCSITAVCCFRFRHMPEYSARPERYSAFFRNLEQSATELSAHLFRSEPNWHSNTTITT